MPFFVEDLSSNLFDYIMLRLELPVRAEHAELALHLLLTPRSGGHEGGACRRDLRRSGNVATFHIARP
jgi:hypothetical protein